MLVLWIQWELWRNGVEEKKSLWSPLMITNVRKMAWSAGRRRETMPRITFWSCLPHNGGRFVLRQSNPYYKKVPPPFLCIFQPKMHLGDKHNSKRKMTENQRVEHELCRTSSLSETNCLILNSCAKNESQMGIFVILWNFWHYKKMYFRT